MLIKTDQNFDSVSSHENSVLSHLISQRSDLILILISCQVRIRSFCSELISFHSDFDDQSRQNKTCNISTFKKILSFFFFDCFCEQDRKMSKYIMIHCIKHSKTCKKLEI